MGIPEYITIAVVVVVAWSCVTVINAVVTRRVFRINSIIERLDKIVELIEERK